MRACSLAESREPILQYVSHSASPMGIPVGPRDCWMCHRFWFRAWPRTGQQEERAHWASVRMHSDSPTDATLVVDPQSSQSDESPHCHSALKELMRILLTAEQLAEGIDRLADAVRSERAVRPLTVVGVLTGSIVLVADLIRRLDGPVRLSMVWASSYRGTSTTAGRLEMRLDLLPDLTGQEVLLVDDIFDTGRTLEAIVDALGSRGAARVRSLVLLRKSGRAEVAIQPDFVGFDIPDVFVVGYGLDYNGSYRHLPHVASLDPSDIAAVHRIHESGGPQ